MTTTTFKVGDMTIHRIVEMECGFTPALEFLPKLTPEMLDDSRSWLSNPMALDAEDRLVLCFQSYIVRTGRHTILVDSCIGNDKDRPARPVWNKKQDNVFMQGLADAGLTVHDIDFVLCTHLHVDHVGWNTRLENGRWVPTFPNARYLFSKDRTRLLAGRKREYRGAADRRQCHSDPGGKARRHGDQRIILSAIWCR